MPKKNSWVLGRVGGVAGNFDPKAKGRRQGGAGAQQGEGANVVVARARGKPGRQSACGLHSPADTGRSASHHAALPQEG
eukprot:scaffold307559_cov25-Tisochrysis_lutea.AAC.1